MKPRQLLPVVLALLAVACGGGGDVSGDGTADERTDAPDGSWQLVSGQGPGGPIAIPADHAITLTFEDDDGGVGGTAACNQYFAEVTVDGDTISITGIGATEMGCMPQTVMEAERAYLETLGRVTTHERSGEQLVLRGPEAELVYDRLAPPPTADLVGTRWELDSLIHGSGPDGAVSSTMGDGGYLILEVDGTLVGSTGCRDLSGTWVDAGGTITTTELAAEGECPEELRSQDAQVVEVLERFRAEVDGRRLTLTHPDGGTGLGYRAG